MKKYLLTMLLLLSTLAGVAQSKNLLGDWNSDNRHSVSLSVGFIPHLYNYYTSLELLDFDFENESKNPNYYDFEEDSRTSLPVFSLSYFYRVGRLFSAGLTVGYGHESTKLYSEDSGEYAFSIRDNVILATPTVRLHWLNTTKVEMYSGLGLLGYGVAFRDNAYRIEGEKQTIEGIALQFTPVGLSVKLDDTYIFSELGLGVYGTFRVGVGHRF